MKKKILCSMLAILMMFCLVFENASVVSASSFRDLTDAEESSIRDVLSTGIMKGSDTGLFNPDSYLTKAEATAIVTRMKGYSNSYTALKSTFRDVPSSHWASQTIGLASSLNLVTGDNGYFYPDKSLNALELITMCLRAIGIGEVLDSTGNWPSAHMQFVSNEEILTGLTKSVYDNVTRLEAARIISQFLTANTWERNNQSGIYEKTDDTILSKYLGASSYKDVIITEVDRSSRRLEGLYKDANGNYTKELTYVYIPSDYDMDNLKEGDLVNLSIAGSQIIKIDLENDSESRIVMYDSIIDYNTSSDYVRVKVDGKTTKYLLSEDLLIVSANGTTKTGTYNNMSAAKRLIEKTIDNYYNIDDDDDDEEDEDIDYSDNEITGRLILDSNNYVISISLAAYDKIIWVKSISNEKITGYGYSKYNSRSGYTLTSLNLKNKDYDLRDIDGNVLDLDDVGSGDVLLTTNDGEPYSLIKLDDSVYGKVTYVDEDGEYITVDGDDYFINDKYCRALPSKSSTKRTIYLDQNEKIVGWK